MRYFAFILVPLLIFSCKNQAQNQTITDYEGSWVGQIANSQSFNFDLSLKEQESGQYNLTVSNGDTLIDRTFQSPNLIDIHLQIDDQLSLELTQNEETGLTGFVKSGRLFYRVELLKINPHEYQGKWHPYMFDDGLISEDIMLYVEHQNDAQLVAYPFLGDHRTRGVWASGFVQVEDTLFFKDDNTGFKLSATFLEDEIEVAFYLAGAVITKARLKHTNDDWEPQRKQLEQLKEITTPADLNDGWTTTNINDFGFDQSKLLQLIADANSNKLENTHSVLVAKQEQLVFEAYFNGFNANIPHDMRSASKSISSAIIGIALNDGILNNINDKIYEYLPPQYQYTKDSLKEKISLHDLLTMSSGLDVNDLASEGTYQDSGNPHSWLKSVLEAPVVKEPGTYADYGSANPFLLGVCLNEQLDLPLEDYMHEQLLAPLGLTNYIIQTDDGQSTPYFGGGMFLTPRDMLKFGQLYLNKGKWKGAQVVTESWVAASIQKHVQLQDVSDKNDYGYQWWHDTYTVNGQEVKAIEARGAGGQFIFILPQLEAVVAITSGNFRNRKGNQPRDILQNYLLPAMQDL